MFNGAELRSIKKACQNEIKTIKRLEGPHIMRGLYTDDEIRELNRLIRICAKIEKGGEQ